MSFESPDIPLPKPGTAPPPPPMFGAFAGQKKQKAKSMQPTFLGADAAPQAGQTGQKTLLGQ